MTGRERSEPRGRPARDFLRASHRRILDYELLVAEAREQLAALPERAWRKRAKLKGRLGALLMADPEKLEEALCLLDASMESARAKGFDRLVVASGIRRATVMQYLGEHEAALMAFEQALTLIRERRILKYRDFALQHMGKCLAELGDIERAQVCFQQALRLRRRRTDPDLVESTERAIDALKRFSGS